MSSRVCHAQRDEVVEDSYQRDDCLAEKMDDFALIAVEKYDCNVSYRILVDGHNLLGLECSGQCMKVAIGQDFSPSKNAGESPFCSKKKSVQETLHRKVLPYP